MLTRAVVCVRVQLKAAGKRLSFAEASQATVFDAASSQAPVAQVLRTRQAIFVPDAQACEADGRKYAAQEYGIKSICYLPVLGGVLEYGTSNSDATADWKDLEQAGGDALPKAELEKAFRAGATYSIFWRRNEQTGQYEAAASFETAAQSLSKSAKSSTDSYVISSKAVTMSIGDSGPIASAGESGCTVFVPNTATCKEFKRSQLAQLQHSTAKRGRLMPYGHARPPPARGSPAARPAGAPHGSLES